MRDNECYVRSIKSDVRVRLCATDRPECGSAYEINRSNPRADMRRREEGGQNLVALL